jgi:hypothetical protein
VVLLFAGFVEVEVAEPEAGKGEDQAPLELQDRGVHPVGLLPPGQAEDAAGDYEVDDADDVAEV